ncbi:hypothetical protein MSSAC_2070 [Methanosarcina siciliae C2J]|uniref:DUF3147 family protein n=1 Tax=Methanosarcina siciliae C2J TaxID=1434118 RepID=A0A0E3PNU6_9EURY|nr:DUF3147 family protein [Methanosarcina siciliae]AKB36660.1 hypothetical protein MSSAC_2070 [Methanosarcina siciliae C2J]
MFDIDPSSLFLRFLFGGSAVLASTLIARTFGGKLGGIFAAFPAVYIAAVVGLSLEYKGNELLSVTEQLSKGALVGMAADICRALAASCFILRYGWKKGLAYALSLWALLAPLIYFTWFGF